MKKSHYETLGVKPDASSAEIKRVFRAKAASAHPDKQGGSHEQMSELNHAFDVLGDPKRRLLYDKTGEDDERPKDEMVRNVLMMAFTDALQQDAPDVLKHAKAFFEQGVRTGKDTRAKVIKQRDKMIARRDKITVKKGEINLFQALIDQQVQMAEQNLARIDSEIGLGEDALKALTKYKSSEKEPAAAPSQWYSALSMGTATTGTI